MKTFDQVYNKIICEQFGNDSYYDKILFTKGSTLNSTFIFNAFEIKDKIKEIFRGKCRFNSQSKAWQISQPLINVVSKIGYPTDAIVYSAIKIAKNQKEFLSQEEFSSKFMQVLMDVLNNVDPKQWSLTWFLNNYLHKLFENKKDERIPKDVLNICWKARITSRKIVNQDIIKKLGYGVYLNQIFLNQEHERYLQSDQYKMKKAQEEKRQAERQKQRKAQEARLKLASTAPDIKSVQEAKTIEITPALRAKYFKNHGLANIWNEQQRFDWKIAWILHKRDEKDHPELHKFYQYEHDPHGYSNPTHCKCGLYSDADSSD